MPKPSNYNRLIFVIALISLITPSFARATEGLLNASIGNNKYRVILADSSLEREKGLSGTKSLAADHGMLFVFDELSIEKSCIWMKDMYYDLDILWFDENKKLVDIKTDVLASSYPETYCPKTQAKYVVELPSGTVIQRGIKKGDKLVIKKQ